VTSEQPKFWRIAGHETPGGFWGGFRLGMLQANAIGLPVLVAILIWSACHAD